MTDTTFAMYPVFRATHGMGTSPLDPDDLARAAREVDDLVKSWAGRVVVRGTYSTTGFRPDADLMLWLIAPALDDVQSALGEFRRTEAGRLLELTWSFVGVVKPAEFTPDHAPAFVKGEPPRTYLCVYPFVRTPEWYLLPREDRGALLAEHGVIGREFPDVLANTTSAFGLGDWEWILAFESDQVDRIVECIRRLRVARARLYTKVEIPFVTGIRKPFAECLADIA